LFVRTKAFSASLNSSGELKTTNKSESKDERLPSINATMKTLLLMSVIASLAASAALAQEKPAEGARAKPASEKPKATPEELEAKFKATMTKATMSGRWCGIKDGVLGEDKEDKYTIIGVSKVSGETWIINARIQYNKQDIVAPIPVQVKWAGDTPVITVDKIPIPGSGTYSARVLIYEHTYAGTWSGGGHGGLMNGVITNEKE
jgi:hypothetical protein